MMGARVAAALGLAFALGVLGWVWFGSEWLAPEDSGRAVLQDAERWEAAMPFPEEQRGPDAGGSASESANDALGLASGPAGAGDGREAQPGRVAISSADSAESMAADERDEFAGAETRHLQGRVRFRDRTPVVGASVEVRHAGRAVEVETGADGRFELEWYTGVAAPLSIASGLAIDLHLSDWGEEQEREFELGRSARLAGRVTPAPSEAGGRVLLLRRSDRPSSSWERRTVDLRFDGGFLFADLDPGEFSVTAVALDRGAPLVAGVVLGEGERFELSLHSAALLELEGVTRTAGGQPVGGVELELRPDGRNWPRSAEQLFERVAVSAQDGTFRFEALLPGPARLSFRTPRGQTGREKVEVGAVEHLDLEVPSAAGLAGFVESAGGQPAAGVEVVVLSASERGLARRAFSANTGPSLARAQTDADGRFTLPDLAEGEPLLVLARGSVAALAGVRVDSLAEGEVRELADVLGLSEGRSLAGRVTSSGGDGEGDAGLLAALDLYARVAGIEVECICAETEADGRFEFAELPDFELRVRVAADGHLGQKVSVAGPGGEELIVELDPELYLSGRVVLEDGAAPRRAAVVLREGGGGSNVRVVSTDAFGNFEMERLKPGEYELDVSGEDLVLTRRAALSVVLDEPRTTGVLLEVERLSREAPASFVGEVWSRTAERLEGLKVSGVGRESIVSSDGRLFEVSGVPPGSYRLRLSADGHGAVELGRFEPASGQRIDLGAVELRAGGRVEVAVETRGKAGKRFHPRVRLTPCGEAAGGPGEGVVNVDFERGEDGVWFSESVLPGRWRLRVDEEGWNSHREAVEVRAEGGERFAVTLSKSR